jgi:hypothetical protein
LDDIRRDGKLRFLELLQTEFDRGQIILNNQGPDDAPPVDRQAAGSKTSVLLMRLVLC